MVVSQPMSTCNLLQAQLITHAGVSCTSLRQKAKRLLLLHMKDWCFSLCCEVAMLEGQKSKANLIQAQSKRADCAT